MGLRRFLGFRVSLEEIEHRLLGEIDVLVLRHRLRLGPEIVVDFLERLRGVALRHCVRPHERGERGERDCGSDPADRHDGPRRTRRRIPFRERAFVRESIGYFFS
jgi:hypothetical protein